MHYGICTDELLKFCSEGLRFENKKKFGVFERIWIFKIRPNDSRLKIWKWEKKKKKKKNLLVSRGIRTFFKRGWTHIVSLLGSYQGRIQEFSIEWALTLFQKKIDDAQVPSYSLAPCFCKNKRGRPPGVSPLNPPLVTPTLYRPHLLLAWCLICCL